MFGKMNELVYKRSLNYLILLIGNMCVYDRSDFFSYFGFIEYYGACFKDFHRGAIFYERQFIQIHVLVLWVSVIFIQ